VRNLEVSPVPGLVRAAREGNSRTPSMYADEKSDEAVVPRKRPNKGRQLPARSWREGLTGGEQPTGAVVRTLEPRCHVDPIGGRCAGAHAVSKPCAADV